MGNHEPRRPAGRPAGLLRAVNRAARAGLFVVMLSAGVALPMTAHAHEYWLSPSTYRAGRGDQVGVSALVGEGFAGVRQRYARERTSIFEVRAARTFDLTPVVTEGDSVFARLIAADDSGTVVVFVSNPSPIEIEAKRFEAYLADDGLDAVRAARARAGESDKPGRERFRRFAKTWVGGAGRAGDSASVARLLRPAGLPCEIIPITDPLVGVSVRVRLLYQGEPVVGALVHAWHQPLREAVTPRLPPARELVQPAAAARTDGRGEAELALGASGEWLVSAVHMLPSSDPDADWDSFWASLTFARPEQADP